MEKQETSKKKAMPLGMILDNARAELTKAVAALQQKYGLPASLLDMILTGVLADIREMKCMEYRQQEVVGDGEHNELSE